MHGHGIDGTRRASGSGTQTRVEDRDGAMQRKRKSDGGRDDTMRGCNLSGDSRLWQTAYDTQLDQLYPRTHRTWPQSCC